MKEDPLIVVGSGIAGLLVARLVADSQPVVLMTKANLYESNTKYSQGGIAAVWSEKDSVSLHSQDTMIAGAGLCEPQAVRFLSENSRMAVEQLIQLGTHFDRDEHHHLCLGLEGAHSVHRILHAGGDATGREIQRALVENVRHHPNIEIYEHTLVTEILTEEAKVVGIHYHHLPSRSDQSRSCRQVVLATGGAGQLYQYTSNPACATGDGVVLAHRIGAALQDLEFYQFHPTALSLPHCPHFLISEALRGEGAILRNHQGKAFMAQVHPRRDLAPRDIVSRAIAHEMAQKNEAPVFLDATHLNSEKLRHRFPTISQKCGEYGVDICKDLIPVTPVAHYMIGGVVTDLSGRTTIPGLYACGEVARTGVHGANRLASNSLLEGAVFSIKIAKVIRDNPWPNLAQWPKVRRATLFQKDHRPDSQSSEPPLTETSFRKSMWDRVGLIRNDVSLKQMLYTLTDCPLPNPAPKSQADFELETMKVLGKLITLSALARKESRGAHFRSDYPENASVSWNG